MLLVGVGDPWLTTVVPFLPLGTGLPLMLGSTGLLVTIVVSDPYVVDDPAVALDVDICEYPPVMLSIVGMEFDPELVAPEVAVVWLAWPQPGM